MSLKRLQHKIITTVMLGAPLPLGGCIRYGRVIGKADFKVAMTNLKNPADTVVIEFKPIKDSYDYYRFINIGDTVGMYIHNNEWNRILPNVYTDSRGKEVIWNIYVNGRSLSDLRRAEQVATERQEMRDAARQIMGQSQSR